jgi:GNAT superfamily N-acetyltransferase
MVRPSKQVTQVTPFMDGHELDEEMPSGYQTEEKCPEPGCSGFLVVRSKYRRKFLGCSNYAKRNVGILGRCEAQMDTQQGIPPDRQKTRRPVLCVRRLGGSKVTIRLAQPQSEKDWYQARQLIEEYAASLNLDLSFQDFAHELEHLTSEYAPPTGAFLLVEENGLCLGCVGLRRFSEGIGEIKRLYMISAARGRGVGRLLGEGIVAAGKKLGYTQLLLDTLPSMKEAQSLYLSLGFKPTVAYRFNPVPGAAFFELDL